MITLSADYQSAFVRMARYSAIVQDIDNRIAGCNDRIAELNRQCEPLHGQIAELQQANPMGLGPDPAHVAALVADPEQRPDIAAITETVSAARKEEDVRQLTIATLQAAVAAIGADIEVIEREIAGLAGERQAAWLAFAKVARDDLHRLFVERFSPILALIMRPMDAISRLRDAENKTLLSVKEGGEARFSHDTLVAVETWDYLRSAYTKEKFFDGGQFGISQRDVESIVAEFRVMLANEVPQALAPV